MIDFTNYTSMILQGFFVGLGSAAGNYFVLKVLIEKMEKEKNK